MLSYQKPRVEYFVQSMRADRSTFNYSKQQGSVTGLGTAGYKLLKAEGGKVVRYSYRSVQRIRNSRRSTRTTPRRQRFTAPIVTNEDVAPLMVSFNGNKTTVTTGGYGTLI